MALLLGAFAEFALLQFLETRLGGLAIAVWVWFFVGGLAALPIYSFSVQLFIRLRVAG